MDDDLPSSPAKVVEFEYDDFPGAKAEPGKQNQNRVIPPTSGCGSVRHRQYTLCLFRHEESGRSCTTVLANSGNRKREIPRNQPRQKEKAKERTKRCGEQADIFR